MPAAGRAAPHSRRGDRPVAPARGVYPKRDSKGGVKPGWRKFFFPYYDDYPWAGAGGCYRVETQTMDEKTLTPRQREVLALAAASG